MNGFSREALKWARTIHIYISMIGFLMFLFFAGTGIVLNHDSFGWDIGRTSEAQVSLPGNVVFAGDQAAVVKALRLAAAVTLPLAQYNAQPDDIEATFAGPGKRTQALIDRRNGIARITVEDRGPAGVLADLHKGAASGKAWKVIMDGVSVLLGVSSLTGLVMILALPKRRRWGIFAAAAGTVGSVVGWWIWVPR